MDGDMSYTEDEGSQGDLNKTSGDLKETEAYASVSATEVEINSKRRKRSETDTNGDKEWTALSKLKDKGSSGTMNEPTASASYSANEMTQTVNGETKTMIKVPRSKDVLLGRGRGIQTAHGNYLMRQIIAGHRKKYCSLMRQDRRKYSEAVLDEVLASGARFLQRKESDDVVYFEQVDREAAHDKVSHSLREKRPSREHNIGDPLPPGHSSARPEDELPRRRRRPASPKQSREQGHSENKSSGLPELAPIVTQHGDVFQAAQQVIPPDVAATTVLLLQAIQSQAQQQQQQQHQQHLFSSMVQNMNQLQHTPQPFHIPPLDFASQLSQLQAIAAMNSCGVLPGSFFLSPPPPQTAPRLQIPTALPFSSSMPSLLGVQPQGFLAPSGGGMLPQPTPAPPPLAAASLPHHLIGPQSTRSTHQTVVGHASLNNNGPSSNNPQTQYVSSILLQALMAANQKKEQTSGIPLQGENNDAGGTSGNSTDEGGGTFQRV